MALPDDKRRAAGKNRMRSLTESPFVIRLRHWEYWPFGIIQMPFFVYWLWLSLRARSLVFFSASNPRIPTGGMFGESKFEILASIPDHLTARSGLISPPFTKEKVLQKMRELGLDFPVILKPDVGERGWRVTRAHSPQDVEDYVRVIRTSFIVQELLDLPLEFGVFYRRFPSEKKGVVTSIVLKEMLTIVGDGHTTFADLILRKERARLQWNTLKETYRARLDTVPAMHEKIELVSIGNHCLGTKFLNATYLVSDELNESFDRISRQIPDFHFGRFDLRASSYSDLAAGNVKIMELNGCGAEPGHIYDPSFSLARALKVMHRHWKDLYRISMENHSRGVPFMSFREAIRTYKRFRTIINSK